MKIPHMIMHKQTTQKSWVPNKNLNSNTDAALPKQMKQAKNLNALVLPSR